MWIQLVTPMRIEVQGVQRQYHAGDWVDIGKQHALLWVSQGNAKFPEAADIDTLDLLGCGILTDHKELLCDRLKNYVKGLPIETGVPCVPYQKTIWIDGLLPVRPELIPLGLSLLNTWEIAVPLMDYNTLAVNIGTDTEREQTKKVIRDLRVPVYNTQLMFIKKTPDTERLIDGWRDAGRTPLAFLRELYRIKPFILALPASWTEGRPKP